MSDNSTQTQKELFKATSIIGGTQLFTIILGIVRTKIIAVLLGPAGIGIFGILQSIVDTIKSATSFGLGYSAVKEIAQANQENDELKVTRSIKTMRRWVVFTGLLGMTVSIALCVPLSTFSFDNSQYALSIAIVSVTILFANISAGQIALLQGLRRIKEMAKASLLGATFGTVVVLPMYWWLGIDGIVPSMVVSAVMTLIASWWYARKVKLRQISMTIKETYKGGLPMVKLGFFIVISGFISLATIYIVRVVIVNNDGVDAAGYFQVVWTITNIYMGLVLNAMLADFFPRLSAIISDKAESIKLVNHQMELTLLVGGILVVGLMTFSDIAISVLYSRDFLIASPVLQWQMLGSLVVFICWPLGVIFLSSNKGTYVIFTDTLWCVLYLAFVYYGWPYFGFNILGMAYVVAIIVKLIFTYFLSAQLIGYRFSKRNLKYMVIITIASIAILLLQSLIVDKLMAFGASSIVMGGAIWYCLKELNNMLDLMKIIKTRLLKR